MLLLSFLFFLLFVYVCIVFIVVFVVVSVSLDFVNYKVKRISIFVAKHTLGFSLKSQTKKKKVLA